MLACHWIYLWLCMVVFKRLKPVASGGINKVVCTCIIPTGEPDLLQVNKSFSKSFSLSTRKSRLLLLIMLLLLICWILLKKNKMKACHRESYTIPLDWNENETRAPSSDGRLELCPRTPHHHLRSGWSAARCPTPWPHWPSAPPAAAGRDGWATADPRSCQSFARRLYACRKTWVWEGRERRRRQVPSDNEENVTSGVSSAHVINHISGLQVRVIRLITRFI